MQTTIAEVRDQLRRQGIRAAVESYADDVCVGAETNQDLDAAVDQLLTAYRKHGWTASPKKCKFGVPEIEFLGYRFTPKGVLPPKGTLQQLLTASPPQTKTAIRSFLGLLRTLLSYCRSDIRSLAALQKLSQATSEGIQQYWKEDPSRWTNIIHSLERVWDNRPDAAGSAVDLYVDASRDGFGYALFDKTTKRLIRMGAGGFQREKFQSSGKAELLGMERSIKEVRHLILGKQLTIFTDATVVKQASGTKDQSFLVQRHLDALNLVAGRVKHIDGVTNVIADLLSRSPWWRTTLEQEKPIIAAIQDTTNSSQWPDWYTQMAEYLRTGRCPEEATPQQRARLKHRSSYFRRRSDKLEYSVDGITWVPCCLDEEEVSQWLQRAHEQSGHYGIHTTTQKLQQLTYFPDAPTRVKSWAQSCPRCQKFARHDPPVSQSFNTWQQFNQCVGLDVIGPLKADGTYKYIIAAVDLCTRFCLLSATSTATAGTIIKLLERWVSLFGNPDSLQTDNAPAFVGNQISAWMSERSIKRRSIPAYRPQCNGTVERLNQEVIRRLQRLSTDGKWARFLPQVQALLNAHPNAITQLSAAQTAFGYQPRLHSAPSTSAVTPTSAEPDPAPSRDTLATRWTAIDAHMAHQQQLRTTKPYRDASFEPGQLVLLFNHQLQQTHGNKLAPQWLGPYRIQRRYSPQLYYITSDSRRQPFLTHRDHLRAFHSRSHAQGSDCHKGRTEEAIP